jgi:excinuclease ABC subunit A
VRVGNLKGPWQKVTIIAHSLQEIDTPAFRKFLDQAVASFQQNLKRMQTRPEDVMPWKLNGERWHLSDKGFPVGKKLRWDRNLLPNLLKLVREVEPKVEINWGTRDCISLRVPGSSRSWGHWRTKEAFGLDVRFLGKKGQFNLAQIEAFGVNPTIGENRADGDVLRLVFQHAEHVQPQKLKELLKEHLAGFREVFGKR